MDWQQGRRNRQVKYPKEKWYREAIWAHRKGQASSLIQSTGHCVVGREFSTSHSPPPSSPLSLLLFLIMPFSPDTEGAMGVQLRQSQSVNAGKGNGWTKDLQCATSNEPWINPNHPSSKTEDISSPLLWHRKKKKSFYSYKIWILGEKHESRFSVWLHWVTFLDSNWCNMDLGDNTGSFKGLIWNTASSHHHYSHRLWPGCPFVTRI